jgi:hypothetical protein
MKVGRGICRIASNHAAIRSKLEHAYRNFLNTESGPVSDLVLDIAVIHDADADLSYFDILKYRDQEHQLLIAAEGDIYLTNRQIVQTSLAGIADVLTKADGTTELHRLIARLYAQRLVQMTGFVLGAVLVNADYGSGIQLPAFPCDSPRHARVDLIGVARREDRWKAWSTPFLAQGKRSDNFEIELKALYLPGDALRTPQTKSSSETFLALMHACQWISISSPFWTGCLLEACHAVALAVPCYAGHHSDHNVWR